MLQIAPYAVSPTSNWGRLGQKSTGDLPYPAAPAH